MRVLLGLEGGEDDDGGALWQGSGIDAWVLEMSSGRRVERVRGVRG